MCRATRHQELGNILFLILLAIVLFAALAAAVTASLRGGGKDMSDEAVKSASGAMLGYMNLVKSEVQRLMVINGCNIENLDWRTNIYTRYNNGVLYTGTPSVAKTGCAVFSDYGGPVTPQEFSKYAEPVYDAANVGSSTLRAGHFQFNWVSMTGIGTTRSDIGMFTSGINRKICNYIINSMNPSLTSVGNDSWTTALPNAAEPSYTTASELIGNLPMNQNYDGVFFDDAANNGCRLGLILIAQ